jgi:hypothetical protein
MGTLSASSRGLATDYQEDWMGVPMYWSSYDAETNGRMVAETGLHIVVADMKTEEFDDETETWLWILANKPA